MSYGRDDDDTWRIGLDLKDESGQTQTAQAEYLYRGHNYIYLLRFKVISDSSGH